MHDSYDAVIVGARCAGAATAMLLARRGLNVLVIDRGQLGSDTLSTHALLRGGVVQLSRWGLLPALEEAGTPPVRSVAFFYGGDRVTIPIKSRAGVDALLAPRRSLLDRVLVEAAATAGADVRFETSLSGLLRTSGGRVHGVAIEGADGAPRRVLASIVIGADGLRSKVARLAAAPPYYVGRHSSAVVYAYWSGLEPHEYEWHFVPGASAGVVPTNGGQCCVMVSTRAREFHEVFGRDVPGGYFRTLSHAAPTLAARLGRPPRGLAFHGFPGHAGYFRESRGAGWALVGDAGCFTDPLNAHGITDALRDAEGLADAVAAGSEAALDAYQCERDELSRPLFDATDAIASYDWSLPGLQRLHEMLAAAMSRELRTIVGRPAVSAA
jgi:2-polyprenyl-6-methoxyphenol hydroxylase-like FAD-dependent oxidoreductase